MFIHVCVMGHLLASALVKHQGTDCSCSYVQCQIVLLAPCRLQESQNIYVGGNQVLISLLVLI